MTPLEAGIVVYMATTLKLKVISEVCESACFKLNLGLYGLKNVTLSHFLRVKTYGGYI